MYEGIVLSGGGIKGFCTLGAIQFLIDNKLFNNITHYYSTSVGSIISILLIIGYSPIEIVIYLCSHNALESLKINNIDEIFNGIYNYSIITNFCENMIMEKIGYIPKMKDIFEKFSKKLYITTYNLTKSRIEYISHENYPELQVTDAMRMSSNLPFVFDKFIYNDDEYIDGGIVDNFPVSITDKTIKLVGIYLETSKKKHGENSDSMLDKILEYVDKIYNILMIPITEREKNKINDNIDMIRIETDINFFQFSLSHVIKLELFSTGYNTAKLKQL